MDPDQPGVRGVQGKDVRFCTLPEINIASENRLSQKETIVFQPSILRCNVSFREDNSKYLKTDSTKGSFVGLMVYNDSLPYNYRGGALYKIGGITRQIGIANAGKFEIT